MKLSKIKSTPANPAAKPPARGISAAPRKLFEVQAKPLETGVTPISQVRPPRRKAKFWAAIFLACALLPAATQETNAPGPAAVPQTNEPATANTKAAETRSSSREGRDGRDGRDRGPRQVANPGTNTVTRATGKQDFSAFRIISERNIFDPNRNPRRAQSNVARPKPKVVDSLGLVGIMSYEKGTFAFFDGSKSEFRKAVKPSQTIGGLKLESLDQSQARLVKNGKTYELRVGMQLKREDEGEWQAGGTAEAYAPAAGAPPGSASTATAPPSGQQQAGSAPAQASPGADNDVLKRLMQRREQE